MHGMIYDLADGSLHNLLGPIASMDDLKGHSRSIKETQESAVAVDKDLDEKLWTQIDKVFAFEDKLAA